MGSAAPPQQATPSRQRSSAAAAAGGAAYAADANRQALRRAMLALADQEPLLDMVAAALEEAGFKL